MFRREYRIVICGSAAAAVLFANSDRYRADADPPAADSRDAQESDQTTRVVQAELPKWKMWTGADRKRELKLEPKSVLRWTNPGTQRVYGDVFVWTIDGRPEAVMSLFKVWDPPRGLHSEMQSLSLDEIAAERDGREIWNPNKPGLAFKDVPDAPVPADSAVRRLQQMRSLAKDFSAELVDYRVNDDGERQSLRLLPAPLFRHQSTDPRVVDGGLFGIVLGTDPEVFLLLEAMQVEKGVRWQYALARMNSDTMVVRYKDMEVARIERALSRNSLRDPYFLNGIPESP
jgi:hypothetical protein